MFMVYVRCRFNASSVTVDISACKNMKWSGYHLTWELFFLSLYKILIFLNLSFYASFWKPCLVQTWFVSGSLNIYRTCPGSPAGQPAWRATTSPGSTTSASPSPTPSSHSPWLGPRLKPPPTLIRMSHQGKAED